MAYTTSHLVNSVMGDYRVRVIQLTADAATQNVETGLNVVAFHVLAPVSCTTMALKIRDNQLTVGTSAAGYIAVSGATSGDIFQVIVYGK
jgi:hypothetical protein